MQSLGRAEPSEPSTLKEPATPAHRQPTVDQFDIEIGEAEVVVIYLREFDVVPMFLHQSGIGMQGAPLQYVSDLMRKHVPQELLTYDSSNTR